jgi:large subunit ribosomal protein L19
VDKIKLVEQPHLKSKLPAFNIGDTVDVHVKLPGRKRNQIFNGTVIARGGSGVTQMFTVRRIVAGEGVERVFPIHSPNVAEVKVKRRGRVRRAKLYYLRDRVGKAVKVKEIIGKIEDGEVKEKKIQKRGKKARAAKRAAAATEAPVAEKKARKKKLKGKAKTKAKQAK